MLQLGCRFGGNLVQENSAIPVRSQAQFWADVTSVQLLEGLRCSVGATVPEHELVDSEMFVFSFKNTSQGPDFDQFFSRHLFACFLDLEFV